MKPPNQKIIVTLWLQRIIIFWRMKEQILKEPKKLNLNHQKILGLIWKELRTSKCLSLRTIEKILVLKIIIFWKMKEQILRAQKKQRCPNQKIPESTQKEPKKLNRVHQKMREQILKELRKLNLNHQKILLINSKIPEILNLKMKEQIFQRLSEMGLKGIILLDLKNQKVLVEI